MGLTDQLRAVCNTCCIYCISAAQRSSGGRGILSRKEAETGNRGPVIETICSNKDMFLLEKEWPAFHPLLEKFNPLMISDMHTTLYEVIGTAHW